MTSPGEYDGIVIGAGHHGLILGSYLAKAGLKVLLLERRLMYGGGLMTEEATLPGFYHNLHSINHFSITSAPWYRDLELSAKVGYVTPRYEFAQPHEDGTALVFSRELDETVRNIARFSAKDAATFREWNAKGERMTREIFLHERFAEPLSADERRALLGGSELGREFLDLVARQPIDAINELFENERIKVLFLFKLSLFGTVLHETAGTSSPAGSLIRAFDLTTGYELCRGGSWNLARGLMETFITNGGTFVNRAEVSAIDVSGGQVTGVRLRDGRSFGARFVASTVDVHQTFEDMVGRDRLPAGYLVKLDQFHYTKWSLHGTHFALAEAPRYASAQFDPNVEVALKYNIGSESIESLLRAHSEVEAKRLPGTVQFGGGSLTVLDPSQAPGRHTAYAWHVVPFEPAGQADDSWEEELADRVLEKWARYAPNMTPANVLARHVYTARRYTRELINMRHGDIFMGALGADQVMDKHFGYQTPIAGLYMAGSATHPNGAITGGAGYISAHVILRDLGVKPWWSPVDPRAQFAVLR